MGSKIDVTKPHLRNVLHREGDREVKGIMVDIKRGKNTLEAEIKRDVQRARD